MSVKLVEPNVYLVGRQTIDENAVAAFLVDEGVESWETDTDVIGEKLIEMGGRLCFDGDTELMTLSGWVPIRDIVDDFQNHTLSIATLNPVDLSFEFQVPIKHHCKYFDGYILKFENRDLSFLVTPDHRQYAARSVKHGYADFKFEKTEALLSSRSFKVLTAPVVWRGVVPHSIEEPEVEYEQVVSNNYTSNISVAKKYSSPFVVVGSKKVISLARLAAHYVCNGSIRDQKKSGRGIVIYGREHSEVRALTDDLGLPSSLWIDPRNSCPRLIIGGGMAVSKYFRDTCGSTCHDKRLPDWVLNLPSDELRVIWSILVKTDGHRYESGREVFSSGSCRMVDQVQEILAKIGSSSYCTTVRGTNGPCFAISRKKGRPAVVLSSNVERVKYSNKVYCVTTDNGIVYVRRNGKVHFSGNCYSSFAKPRPGGNKAYIDHILESGHGSIVEHSIFNFIITGVPRSFTHELVRHRAGWSYSELSQRFVDESDCKFVVPPLLREGVEAAIEFMNGYYADKLMSVFPRVDSVLRELACEYGPIDGPAMAGLRWLAALERDVETYRAVSDYLVGRLVLVPGLDATSRRKQAREAARSVLPECTETKIFVTSNVRALRHFIEMRASLAADALMREVALLVLGILRKESPNLFGDFEVKTSDDGREYAVAKWHKV